MSRQSVVLSLLTCFLTFVTFSHVSAKVIPSSPWAGASPWAGFAQKSVYSRSLGPPAMSGFGTINVPYMPKSPFFPKFVDPKTMISKKTDMLSNLFGGVGATPDGDAFKAMPGSFLQYAPAGEQSDDIGSKLDDISKLYSSMEGKRSATLFADEPVSSLKDTKASDKGELKDPNSSSTDGSSNPEDSQNASGTIKEYLPGMFGPVAMDPSIFIEKKYSFLDTLFKNLATTTSAPTTTEATPKSTIVPPEFWIPSSAIPEPTEYSEKVSAFLDKLFDAIKANLTSSTTPEESSFSTVSGARVARSIEDVPSIIAAKDAIIETILSQLASLKNNMVSVLNDTIAYQRAMSMSSPMIPKKPFLPSMWMKPTVDPMLPFQQKMTFLSQMFDTLLQLQKNIATSIQETVKSELTEQSDSQSSDTIDEPLTRDAFSYNGTLLDAVAQSLAQSPLYPAAPSKTAPKKIARATPSATSFWVAYPEDAHNVAKRHAVPNNLQYAARSGNDFNYAREKLDASQSTDILQKYDRGDNDINYDTDGEKEKVEKLKKYINRMEYIMNVPKEHRHHHHHY